MSFFAVLAVVIAGAYVVTRISHAIRISQQISEKNKPVDILDELEQHGPALTNMSDERLHKIHMNIHEELKRRMAGGSQK